jgi:hypothetical protein
MFGEWLNKRNMFWLGLRLCVGPFSLVGMMWFSKDQDLIRVCM